MHQFAVCRLVFSWHQTNTERHINGLDGLSNKCTEKLSLIPHMKLGYCQYRLSMPYRLCCLLSAI